MSRCSSSWLSPLLRPGGCDLRRRGGGGGGAGGHAHIPQPKLRDVPVRILSLPKRDGRCRHVTTFRRTSFGGADHAPGHSGASLVDVLQFLRASGHWIQWGKLQLLCTSVNTDAGNSRLRASRHDQTLPIAFPSSPVCADELAKLHSPT